jgi:hypothetical protein
MMKNRMNNAPLRFPEYGRFVEQWVAHVVEMADREERTRASYQLVKLMATVHPEIKQHKETDEFQHLLWNHLFKISNYRLEIDAPYPIAKKEAAAVPTLPEYPTVFKGKVCYGKCIPGFIQNALKMEAGAARNAYALLIANLMKRAYIQWNSDYANDELIKEDLRQMSGGVLSIEPGVRLKSHGELLHGAGALRPQPQIHSKNVPLGGMKNKMKKKPYLKPGNIKPGGYR